MGRKRGGQIDPIRAVAARAVHDPHGGEVFKALLTPSPTENLAFRRLSQVIVIKNSISLCF